MDKKQTIELITTEDGSHTLHLPDLDETYHSIHGAIQESNHVFVNAGLNYWLAQNQQAKSISILEYGFGTGLNALLTAIKIGPTIKVHYHTLEKYPLPKEIIRLLNYGKVLHNEVLFDKIHRVGWDKEEAILPDFLLWKISTDFSTYNTTRSYDIIYFDAFAPSKQPELWTKEIFNSCYKLLNKGAVLVTYSAKGQLKRDLKSIGFRVESLPGPPGKFEITRALKG